MKILICGASGFIGRHLLQALQQAGHECIKGQRTARSSDTVAIDYCRDTRPETWLPRLRGIDAVINAIGVLRDTRRHPMALLHTQAPAALFEACAQAGVKRVVHVSALGVGSDVDTAYFRTKAVAEEVLAAQGSAYRWLVLRPSVVYGEDGASVKLFRLLARLPVQGLPMGGKQVMQPVHVDDLCAAVQNWLADPGAESATVTAAGADVLSMAQMLASYRRQLGHRPAWQFGVPGVLVRLGARCGDLVPASPLCTETLRMLEAGSTGDNRDFAALLGRAPRSVHAFISGEG